ncbi:unnamed protein product [Adineta ricciae]|uniref:Uncharacterized protein n=1 Tax=Adineta ricciae TaxID=249248 RepID=A0A815SKT6_ADIRI|nr:unnamed protein product [Adineta ricciae]CAF1491587.1 unnamed protein product [Adineta ricciae]
MIAENSSSIVGSSLLERNGSFGILITDDVLYIGDSDNDRTVIIHCESAVNISIIGYDPNLLNSLHDLIVLKSSLYVVDTSNGRVLQMPLDGSNLTNVTCAINL